MTDQELLAYQREHHGGPLHDPRGGEKDAAGGPAVLASGGGPELADREAQDEAPIARTLPSHTRSDSAPSVSSMSVAGSRRCL
jgi:hypothetical protein